MTARWQAQPRRWFDKPGSMPGLILKLRDRNRRRRTIRRLYRVVVWRHTALGRLAVFFFRRWM